MSRRPAEAGPRSYLPGMRSRALTLALRIAAAVVVALHAGLLYQRIADHSIANPDVIARWLVAALIALAALHLLHRRASSRVWLVFAIAVVLMHVSAPPQAIFVVAPLIAIVLAPAVSRPRNITRFLAISRFAVRCIVSRDCTADRAPPLP